MVIWNRYVNGSLSNSSIRLTNDKYLFIIQKEKRGTRGVFENAF